MPNTDTYLGSKSHQVFQFVLLVVWFHHCFLLVFGNPAQDVLNATMSEIVKNLLVCHTLTNPSRMKLCFIVVVHYLQ